MAEGWGLDGLFGKPSRRSFQTRSLGDYLSAAKGCSCSAIEQPGRLWPPFFLVGFGPGLTQALHAFSRVHPGTTPETLDLGQPKAGNGFGTLDIGGGKVPTLPVRRQSGVGWVRLEVAIDPNAP